MTWFERVVSFFKREARGVKDSLGKAGRTIDEEVAKRERELAATPEQRIDMILEEQDAEDARFDELAQKVRGELAETDAVEEIGETPGSDPESPAG